MSGRSHCDLWGLGVIFYFPEWWDLLLSIFLVGNQRAALRGEQRCCFITAEVSNSKGEGNGEILPEILSLSLSCIINRQEADNTQDILILKPKRSLLDSQCLHPGPTAFLDMLRNISDSPYQRISFYHRVFFFRENHNRIWSKTFHSTLLQLLKLFPTSPILNLDLSSDKKKQTTAKKRIGKKIKYFILTFGKYLLSAKDCSKYLGYKINKIHHVSFLVELGI